MRAFRLVRKVGETPWKEMSKRIGIVPCCHLLFLVCQEVWSDPGLTQISGVLASAVVAQAADTAVSRAERLADCFLIKPCSKSLQQFTRVLIFRACGLKGG